MLVITMRSRSAVTHSAMVDGFGEQVLELGEPGLGAGVGRAPGTAEARALTRASRR